MRKALKRLAALALCTALCLSLAGCYSESNSWAARNGDETMPIGGYIYYLYSAYYDAQAMVSTEDEVLKASIEGQSAEDWIRDDALTYLKSYFFVGDKCKQLGLSSSAEDEAEASATTDGMWTYWRTTMEDLGVAKASFNQAYSLYNTRYMKLLYALYGEGGELAIPEDEMKTYYAENYVDYEYVSVSTMTTDDDGNSVLMEDAALSDVENKLAGYQDKIELGDITLEEVADDYNEGLGEDDNSANYYSPSTPAELIYLSSAISGALQGMADDEYSVVEGDSAYYLLHKRAIEDQYQAMKEDEDRLHDVIYDMRADDFSDYVKEQGKAFGDLEVNQSAINRIKLSKLVSDNNKSGTSSQPETDGDESSDAE